MKNTNKIISLLLSVSITLSILTVGFAPIISSASEETIYIESAEDLISLSKKCSYDAWSIGKTVILKTDISLKDAEFAPIPSFSGIFDGNGHTISGLKVSGSYSPAGLIAYLEKDGVVKNLNLSGVISPEGDKGYVGGIVGESSGRIENCAFAGTVIGKSDVGGIVGINRVQGSISGCTVGGEIIGENRVGGIAGSNDGFISSSVNEAKINTIAINPGISLSDINLSLTLDITKLPSFSTAGMTDVGGIAGYSSGIIMGSHNTGRVGYPHIGYNVGGIAGRSSGHMNGNVNRAEVYGRKDVGGIVGQAEPNISYELSEDLLKSLKAELDSMSAVIDGATDGVGGSIPTISARLDTIITNIDLATDALNTLMNDGADFGNGFISEINRTGEILDEVISQLSGITADIPTLTALIESSLSSLDKVLCDVEKIGEIGSEAIKDIKSASDEISLAFGSMSDALTSLEGALKLFEESINIKDKEAAKASLDTIANGLSSLVSSINGFTNSIKVISDIIADAKWVDKGLSEIDSLVRIFGNISEYVSTIYDTTTEIGDNIDVNWDKITEAGDELSNMVSSLADTARSLADAAALMEGGIDSVSEGLSKMAESVSAKDQAALDSALQQISEGLSQLVSALGDMSDALGELSDIIANSDQLTDIFGDGAKAFGNLAKAMADMSDAAIKLTNGINTLLENIEIDTDKLGEGGSLVIAGMEDISESLGMLGECADSLADSLESLDKAITAIRSAVLIKDEAKLSAALDSAYVAIGGIIDSMVELSDLMSDIAETLKEAKLWGDELTSALNESAKILTEISDAMLTVQGGVDELRKNVSFDLDKMEGGLEGIRKGLRELADAGVHLENSFAHISDALVKFEEMGVYMPDVMANLRQALSYLGDAMNLLTSMSEKIGLLVGYLDGVDPIQFPTLDSSTIETANQLFIYISAIEKELKALNTDITSLSSDLVERVGRLNEIFTNISNNIVNNIYDLQSGDIIDDNVSEEEIDEVTDGKIFSCQNLGAVSGDYNVGGIAGAMGLEYTIDPEDDLTEDMSLTQRKKYRLQVVIHACQNEGAVSSKYDYAGGVAGKMDMGLIYGSETYCNVISQSGNYVGGIAGITSGLISQCYAKSYLEGGKYIGGIVGSGVAEDISGESSMVRNCYSMIEIGKLSQYGGAISGINSGNFSENLFVSDDLAGIDRVSYAGKAEPISYEDLIKRKSLPTGFYVFTLDFVADGEIIHTVTFEYGQSFDASVFPEMPIKEGNFGKWDRTDLTNLRFDTTVSVVYKPYITTLSSEEKRDGGKNIFFVIGEFTDDDRITAQHGADTSALTLEENMLFKDRLTESWTLTIPKDSLEKNNIHLLAEGDNCKVFIKVDGMWKEVESKEFGSYITFDVSGETVEIAIVESNFKISFELAVLIALVVVQAVVIVCIIVGRKNKKKKTEKKA